MKFYSNTKLLSTQSLEHVAWYVTVMKSSRFCCKVIGSVEPKFLLRRCTEVTAWTEKLLAIW